MKRSQPRRNWRAARHKVEDEGSCRACGVSGDLEAAHVIERGFDRYAEIGLVGSGRVQIPEPWPVHPDRIIPLCSECHRMQHSKRFDILPILTLSEQLQAVADLGGIEAARIRLGGHQNATESLSAHA